MTVPSINIEILEGEVIDESSSEYASTQIYGSTNFANTQISSRTTHHQSQTIWIKLDNGREFPINAKYSITNTRVGHRVKVTRNTFTGACERMLNMTTNRYFELDSSFKLWIFLYGFIATSFYLQFMMLPFLNIIYIYFGLNSITKPLYRKHHNGLKLLSGLIKVLCVVSIMSAVIAIEAEIRNYSVVADLTTIEVSCSSAQALKVAQLDNEVSKYMDAHAPFFKDGLRLSTCTNTEGDGYLGLHEKNALTYIFASSVLSMPLLLICIIVVYLKIPLYIFRLDRVIR